MSYVGGISADSDELGYMYVYLALSIITTTLFAACYKVAVEKQCNLLRVNTWVYIGSLATILIYILIKGHLAFNLHAALLGAFAGIAAFIATLTFFIHIQSGQLSASWTVISLALAFPVLASICIWHEHPTPKQAVGLALIVVALILFGRKEIGKEKNDK